MAKACAFVANVGSGHKKKKRQNFDQRYKVRTQRKKEDIGGKEKDKNANQSQAKESPAEKKTQITVDGTKQEGQQRRKILKQEKKKKAKTKSARKGYGTVAGGQEPRRTFIGGTNFVYTGAND